MTGEFPELHVNQLLERSTWLRQLAQTLVRDATRADDLAQDAWVTTLEHPPREPRLMWSWLKRVARNLAARQHRDATRRQRREFAAARSEMVIDQQSLLERAELQRSVAEAVLLLDEPYRSTVLLRYYEELTPPQIAELLHIPVATVWTRLHRAAEQLRGTLDERYGARGVWCLLLLPGASSLVSSATLEGSMVANSSAAAVTQVTASTTLSQAALGGITLGGLIVSKSAIVMSVVVGVAMLGVGIGTSSLWLGDKYEGPRQKLAQERDSLQQRTATLTAELDTLRAEHSQWQTQRAELQAKLAAAEQQLELAAHAAATPTKPTVAATPTDPQRAALLVAFGPHAELGELAAADWKKLAISAKNLQSSLDELIALVESGGEPSQELGMRIAKNNTDLAQLTLSLYEKLPTNAHGNGEFTHPLLIGNLVGSVLDAQALPLSNEQREELVHLGTTYESEWQSQSERYGDDTYQLRKILDELEMKQRFMAGFEDTLDAGQRSAVFTESVRDVFGLDIYSPTLMLAGTSEHIPVTSPEAFESELQQAAKKRFDLSDEEMVIANAAFRAWSDELRDGLESVDPEEAPYFKLQDATRSGRAQQRAVEALLRTPGLSQAARERILKSGLLLVPRLIKKKAG
ncbi:MAG: sigma-70 family RNA polymerase sigma factor [Planctomycetota bacterium]